MRQLFKIMYKNREWLLLCLVLGIAYCIRIFGIKIGLPYPWHGDEPAVIHTALRILKTGDYNPHFFYYPTLVIYCQTVNAILCYFYAMGHQLLSNLDEITTYSNTVNWLTISHPVFYACGRHLTVIFGTLSVGIVYLICSRYYSSVLTAVFAALFLACNIAHLSLSIWITTDVPTAFFVLATAFSSILIMLKGEKKHYVISGLLAGLSISAKYNAVPVVILPLLGPILNKDKNQLLSANVWYILITIPLGFMLGCPYAVGDLPGFLKDAASILNMYNNNPGEKATMFQQLVSYYNGFCNDRNAMGGGGGVGTFMLYCAIAGMFSGFFVNWRLHLLLLAYPIFYVLYMSTVQLNYMRNMIAVNAFLFIFAGLFICQLLTFASSILNKVKIPDMYRKICLIIASILFFISPLYEAINWAIEVNNARDSRSLAVEWMDKNVNRPQKAAFVKELSWFKPDLDKLGFEHILIGQLEKEPVWFWNEDFDYVVVGRKYRKVDAAGKPNALQPEYNQSFSNMTVAKSFGNPGITLGFLVSPLLNILKVDASFCDAKHWEKNSDSFEFNLNEFKGNSFRKSHPLDEISKQAAWEINTPFCSPKVIFEEGKYEVEITAYGTPSAGVEPLIKLESIKWAEGREGKNETIGEWQVAGLKTLSSGVLNCSKGDVISFNVIFSNSENKQEKASARQLNICRIIVRKKA